MLISYIILERDHKKILNEIDNILIKEKCRISNTDIKRKHETRFDPNKHYKRLLQFYLPKKIRKIVIHYSQKY